MQRSRTRLLLINPWIYDFTAFDLWSKPLGLLYLASYLQENGFEVDYIDCLDRYQPRLVKWLGEKKLKVKDYGAGAYFREIVEKPDILKFVPRHFARYGLPEELFLSELKNRPAPDAILVTSLMTYWYPGPRRVIEWVRDVYPGKPVILGGIYATLLADHAKKVLQPDYLVEGRGEIQVLHLLSDIFNMPEHADHRPCNLDDLPYPLHNLYRRLDYLPMMTSRGCPYRCTFCATDKISGDFTQRDPEKVLKEMFYFARQYKIRDIAFYDDALLLNKQNHIIPILDEVIRSKVNLRFHTPNGIHVRQIDQSLADLFYRSGFRTIRLSFESFSSHRQSDMKSKVKPDDLASAVRYLVRAGYQRKSIEAYVLMGLPEQSFDEVYESVLFVHSLGIKVRLASFSPIPGTPDYQRAVEKELFPPNADPLLSNKTIFPLHRTEQAYRKFSEIRQTVNLLNEGADRRVNLFRIPEFSKALHTVGRSIN